MDSSESNHAEVFQNEKNNCTSVNIEEIVYDESSDQQSESMDLDQQSGKNIPIQSNSICPAPNKSAIPPAVPTSLASVLAKDGIKSTPKNDAISSSVITEENQPISRFRRARIRETIEQWSSHRIVAHDSRVKAVPNWVLELHKQSNQMQEKLKFALDQRLYCYFCMKINSFDLSCKNRTESCSKCLVNMETLDALQDAANIHRQWLMEASLLINNQCKKNPDEIQKPAILDEHEKLFEKWIDGERREIQSSNSDKRKFKYLDGDHSRLDILAQRLIKELNHHTKDGILDNNPDLNRMNNDSELDRRAFYYTNNFGFSHHKPNPSSLTTYEILEKTPQLIKFYPFNADTMEVHQNLATNEGVTIPNNDSQVTLGMKQCQIQTDLSVNSHLIHQFQGSHHPHQFTHTKLHHPLHTVRLTRIPKNSYNQVKDGPSDEFLLLPNSNLNIPTQNEMKSLSLQDKNIFASYPIKNQHHLNSIQYSMEKIGPYNHHGNCLSVDVDQQKIFSKSDQNFHSVNETNNHINTNQRHFLPAHVIDLQSSAPPTSPAVINGTINNPKVSSKATGNIDERSQLTSTDIKKVISPPNTPQLVDEQNSQHYQQQPQHIPNVNDVNLINSMLLQKNQMDFISNQKHFNQPSQQQILSQQSQMTAGLNQVKTSMQLEGNIPNMATSINNRTNSLPIHPNALQNPLHQNISLINSTGQKASSVYSDGSYEGPLPSGLPNNSIVGGHAMGNLAKNPNLSQDSAVNLCHQGNIQMIPNMNQKFSQNPSQAANSQAPSKNNRFSVTTANTHSNPSMESSVYNNERQTEKISNSQPGEQVDFNQTSIALPQTTSTKTTTSATSVTSASISQQNLTDPSYHSRAERNAYKRIATTNDPSVVYQHAYQNANIVSKSQNHLISQQQLQQISQHFHPGNMANLMNSKHQSLMNQQKQMVQGINNQPIIVPISTAYQHHQQNIQPSFNANGNSQMDMNGQNIKLYNQIDFMSFETKFNATIESMKKALLKCSEEEINRLSNELNVMKESYNEVNSRLLDANRIISDYQKILYDICNKHGLNYNDLVKSHAYRQQRYSNQPHNTNDSYPYQQMQKQAQFLSKMSIHTGHSTPSSSVTSNTPQINQQLTSNQSNCNYSGQMNHHMNNQQTMNSNQSNTHLNSSQATQKNQSIAQKSFASANSNNSNSNNNNANVNSTPSNKPQHRSPS